MSTGKKMLPAGAVIVRQTRKFAEVLRADGLTVFLDKYESDSEDARILEQLNYVRLHAAPDDVIMFVGMVRGLQIARSYSRKEKRSLQDLDAFLGAMPTIRKLIDGGSQRKHQKRIRAEKVPV